MEKKKRRNRIYIRDNHERKKAIREKKSNTNAPKVRVLSTVTYITRQREGNLRKEERSKRMHLYYRRRSTKEGKEEIHPKMNIYTGNVNMSPFDPQVEHILNSIN